MNIYFSGIGGVGLGPLAEIAHEAGYAVSGSDKEPGPMTDQLKGAGINLSFDQSGNFLKSINEKQPIDWMVYTSALPKDHPEIITAKKLGIKTSKRDEFLASLITEKNLKLIAVTGTHGKTTTTGIFIWAMQQLSLPASYLVGSTITFGPSGKYDESSEFLIYECDEFDRNFLNFKPWLSLTTSIDYDHPDTYPSKSDYLSAFYQFSKQSRKNITWQKYNDTYSQDNTIFLSETHPKINLAGAHNRANATLVFEALKSTFPDMPEENIINAINSFPGTGRRFEKLAKNLYTDYGHHPNEIKATLQMASELSSDVVLVYQPHQNIRQHEVRHLYTDCAEAAQKIYWLPTFLTREDPGLETLQAEELTENLTNKNSVIFAELNDELWNNIQDELSQEKLVLLMGAGTIDGWARQKIKA